MSYTVEVPATVMEPEFDHNHGTSNTVYATTFAGGKRGRMVQLSFGFNPMACLTMDQLTVLIDVLRHAREESLQSHPLYGLGEDE